MSTHSLTLFIAAAFSLLLALPTQAQQPPHHGEDPIGAGLYGPDVIMNHQSDIGLKASQRQAIIGEMKKAQSKMVDIQFKMKAATQELIGRLSPANVDEGKAIAALHKLTQIENEMKTIQVTMMIRIKNALTTEQQDKLRSFPKPE